MKITNKEMREWILSSYLPRFPGWELFGDDTIVRTAGPILQGVCFQRLSYGAYRPMAFVRVLCSPEGWLAAELPHMLKDRHGLEGKSVDRRAHDREATSVVDAIRREITPSVEERLDPEKMLEVYELEAAPIPIEAYSLATLNAYLGNDERAREWIRRYPQLLPDDRAEWAEWDLQRDQFLQQLAQWIEQGIASQQLENVVRKERRALGLPEE